MKVFKKTAEKAASLDVKMDKAKGEATVTKKKPEPKPEQYSAILEAVKIMVSQNAEIMAMLTKPDDTKQIIEEVANIIAKKMDTGKTDTQLNEQLMLLLAKSGQGRTLDIKVNTRDNEGFMETATVKIRPELLN